MRGRLLLSSFVWFSCCGADDSATTESSDTLASMTTAPTTASSTSMTMNTTETSGVASTTSTGSTTTSSDGAPFFLSFSTNVGTITDGESVVFTATVSDPDGLDDIAGGTLFTGDGAFSYGPFVAAGQEGTYSITISWGDIDQVETIEFENYDLDRTFRAEFFDAKGKSASRDTKITLNCPGGGACGGACKDFQVDADNCGSCGKACGGGCESGACGPIFGECINMDNVFASCSEYCQGVGEQCVESGCNGLTYSGYDSDDFCVDDVGASSFSNPCEHINSWVGNEVVIRCCCTDST